MANSISNFDIINQKSKTKKEELKQRMDQHPANNDNVYATIKVNEIVKGMTADDFNELERSKKKEFAQNLDASYKE